MSKLTLKQLVDDALKSRAFLGEYVAFSQAHAVFAYEELSLALGFIEQLASNPQSFEADSARDYLQEVEKRQEKNREL